MVMMCADAFPDKRNGHDCLSTAAAHAVCCRWWLISVRDCCLCFLFKQLHNFTWVVLLFFYFLLQKQHNVSAAALWALPLFSVKYCSKLCRHRGDSWTNLSKQESKAFLSSASPAAFTYWLQQEVLICILSLSLSDRQATQGCAPTFTIRTLWLALRQNTAGCGHISLVRTHRRTWMAGSGPWTRLRWCSRVTL